MTDAAPDDEALATLRTIRDWLRFATSRFAAAGLVYGHGTTRPVDEAAFLILHTLSLPIDELDPWLDARLTPGEARAVARVIERRITTRKPAAYLTNEAWIGGVSFYVDERVIVPRSLIGELLSQGQISGLVEEERPVQRVLDLCTGSGCLAILAAMAWPEAMVDAVDIDEGALAVARRNVETHGLEARVRLIRSDLFHALDGGPYDLIISNPPYVRAAAVAAFPPEHRAEPALAHDGGADGLEIIRRIIAEAPGHLHQSGHLVLEVGGERATLEQAYPMLRFLALDTAETSGEVLAIPGLSLPGAEPQAGRRKSGRKAS